MKKNFAKYLSLTLLIASVVGTGISNYSFADNVSIQKDIIKPLGHIKGEVVNTLPLSIQEWYNTEATDAMSIYRLYSDHPDMNDNNWKTISVSDYAKKFFKEGSKAVSITYNGKTYEVPVIVTEKGTYENKTPVNLIVDGEYKTCYQAGESFDKGNIVIKEVFSTGTTSKVTDKIVWDKSTLSSDDTFVTGSYDGLTIKLPVLVSSSVSNPSEEFVGLTYTGTYKAYYGYGDCFNRTNFNAIARFADGSTKNVTSELTWPEDVFDSTAADKSAYQSALYDKWDDFHQINNVLKWTTKDEENVTDYNITVSFDPELTQVLYKGVVTEPEYKMMNLYTGKDYYWQVKVNKNSGESVKSPIYHFKTAVTPRTLYVQGISNTRDIGGYTTQFGEIKQGYVFRGARVDEASELGKDVFKNELSIRSDIDLRTGGNEAGRYNPMQVAHYYGPVDFLAYQMLDPDMNPYNDNNPTGRKEALRRLKYVFDVFAEPENYPIYYHCTVGRDRTGTVGAILDALLGETEEQVIHNYFISVFSVTGHYQYKDIYAGFNNCLSIITAMKKARGAEGKSLADQAACLLLEAGITQEQIDSIRNIMTGKDNRALNALKFLTNDDNYKGQVVVTFKQEGDGEEQVFAPINSKINAPFTLKEGYGWYDGDTLVDLNNLVTKSMNLVSKRIEHYNVTIHYMKGERDDVNLQLMKGEVININDYALNGVVPTAYLDTGKEISTLTVNRDCVINLLF